MLILDNVTLIGIDGRNDQEIYNLLIKIADYSSKDINFNKIKILTGTDNKSEKYNTLKVNINGISEYSKFCMGKLTEYVDTDYCILYQIDGFILHPNLWDDNFLNYDYIGAPWPLSLGWVHSDKRVGNGGFSLRSKKLLEECKKTPYTGSNEDTQICYKFRDRLIKNNIKFCPVELAAKFSLEHDNEFNTSIDNCFGFHGCSRDKEIIKKYLK